MKLSAATLAQIHADAVYRYPKEACGLVLADGSYRACDNLADDPTKAFRISSVERLLPHVAVIHSHPYDNREQRRWPAEWPSTADMTAWLEDTIPWGIVACDGEGITQPVWLDEQNPEPLIGRTFIHGINDCYSVIRDWFRLERGITLRNFARGMEWWNMGQDLYSENFKKAGFIEIPVEEARAGDGLLMRVHSRVINHAAVLVDDHTMLHHAWKHLSGTCPAANWYKQIVKAARYVGEENAS